MRSLEEIVQLQLGQLSYQCAVLGHQIEMQGQMLKELRAENARLTEAQKVTGDGG